MRLMDYKNYVLIVILSGKAVFKVIGDNIESGLMIRVKQ